MENQNIAQNITLRDYFAAAALQGLLAKGLTLFNATKYAYEAADQMLVEREKKKDT